MIKRIQPFFLLISFFFVYQALHAQAPAFNNSYEDIEEINIQLIVTDLEIRNSEDNKVMINGYYDNNLFRFEVNKTGSSLKIKEEPQRGGRNYSSSQKWVIFLPKNVKVKSNQASGNTDIRVASNQITCNTGSGNYDLNDSEGTFYLNTGSGNINAKNITGNLKLNTGSGNINASDLAGKIIANTGSGNVSGTNITITGASSFNTGTGKATLSLGASNSAGISINSGTGKATLKLNGNQLMGNLTMQCSKYAGHIKAPFSFDHTYEEGNTKNNTTLYKEKSFGNQSYTVKIGTGTGEAKIEHE